MAAKRRVGVVGYGHLGEWLLKTELIFSRTKSNIFSMIRTQSSASINLKELSAMYTSEN